MLLLLPVLLFLASSRAAIIMNNQTSNLTAEIAVAGDNSGLVVRFGANIDLENFKREWNCTGMYCCPDDGNDICGNFSSIFTAIIRTGSLASSQCQSVSYSGNVSVCSDFPILYGIVGVDWQSSKTPLDIYQTYSISLQFLAYTVPVSNRTYASLSRTMDLKIFPPSPPKNVTLLTDENGLLTVSWAITDSSIPISFTSVRSVPGVAVECNAIGNATSCSFNQPFVGGGQRFIVTPNTLLGIVITSVPSSPIPPSSSQPTVAVSSSSIDISWNAPVPFEDGSDFAESYVVLCQPPVVAQCNLNGPTSCSLDTSHFNPSQTYQFQVIAVYNSGIRSLSVKSELTNVMSPSLSVASIVGIAVGVFFAVLIIAVATVYFYRVYNASRANVNKSVEINPFHQSQAASYKY